MNDPDFSNTEIAFERYTTGELKRAQLMFSILKRPWVVKTGKALLQLALFTRFPVGWIIRPTIFRHFCGGERLEECLKTAEKLNEYGVITIPDYSAEGKSDERFFDHVRDEILEVIRASSRYDYMPYAVFKPSGIIRASLLEKVSSNGELLPTEKEEWERGRNRFEALCDAAARSNLRIMVDAEHSWVQGAIDALTEEMMMKYNTAFPLVYQTIQMYRTDRLDYLKNLCERFDQHQRFTGFKVVRGAYMEKERARAASEGRPSPIYPDKPATDRAYDEAVSYILSRFENTALCLASHNEESAMSAVKKMLGSGISLKHPNICFAQLYGMSDHISFNLVRAGFNTVKYVPYGPVRTVMPYLIRRAEENTSVAGQTGRELANFRKELDRRRR